MKKLHATIVLLLLFVSFAATAQTPAVKLTGRVIEQDTKLPLEFATILVQNPSTGETVTGGMTDNNGEYNIDVNPGIYNIKIEFISFKTVEINNQQITADTNLGTRAISPDVTVLEGVEIIAERSSVEIKLDKKVYNVGQDMIVKGGTVSDVLDNVPSVSVDIEGNVSLRGNESVRILIDGKPSGLAGINVNEALRMLPADAVEKVEVITNPSARYEAEGGAGIINIILRKGKAGGLNGSVIATTGTPDNHGLTGNLNFRSENYNLFSTAGYSYRKSPGNSMTNSEYFDAGGNTTNFIDERRNNERLRKAFTGNFGMEWFLDETTTWTNSFSIRRDSEENPDNVFYYNYDANREYRFTRNRLNEQFGDGENVDFSSHLIKKFNNNGHEISINASVAQNKDDENSLITDRIIDGFSENDDFLERTLNNRRQTRNLLQADYVLPIGENSRFEAGYRGDFTKLTTDAVVETLTGNEWINNPNFTNTLEYKEKVNALYTQYGSKINRFSYLLGLRWEDSNIDVNLLNNGDFNNKRYNNFFPSAFVTYEFSETSSASISYSRRINRPRGRFLNPFSNYSSNINVFQGNPDLDPSMTNSFDLGYLKRWNKLTLNTSAYFNVTDDSFQFVRRESGDFIIQIVNGEEVAVPVIISTPVNLAKQYRFGFEFTLNYNPYRWWRLNGNFNFYRNETDGDFSYINFQDELITQNFDNVAYSWFARINSRINLPYGIDWQLNGIYNAPEDNAQGRSRGILSANTAISKDLLKERATIALNVSDIFNSRKRIMDTYLPTLHSYSEMQWRERQITLSFTYRFNMKKNERQRQPQQNRESDGGEEFMGG